MSDVPKDLQVQIEQTALMQANFETKVKEMKAAEDDLKATWKQVEAVMIENDIKSVKGDWGSITIAERQNFKGNVEDVPPKFIKKTLDTTKIATYYTLEGKLPKGVERSTTKYLTKRIKKD